MQNRILETKLIKWADIQDLQPENIKVNINRDALKTSLEKYGFAQPFYGWENKGKVYMIDGHERKSVLSELKNVPELLPCTFIDAKNKTEAVKILIEVYNQKHNPFDKDILTEFLEVENIEISEISIEDINVKESINVAEPSEEELIGDYRNKPATMKITFESPEQLQKAEIDIQELLDRKYKGAYYSISAGEL